MNLTNTQIEQILNDAPEGATHRTAYCYLKNGGGDSWFWYNKTGGHSYWQGLNGKCDISEFEDYRSLGDLREILSLRRQVELLKEGV